MGQFKPVTKGKEQAKPAQKATFQQPVKPAPKAPVQPTKQPQKAPVQPTKAAAKR